MTDTLAAGPELGAVVPAAPRSVAEDRDYDAARAVYNGSIDRRPALIAAPDAAPPTSSTRWPTPGPPGLQLAVRCGGHGVAGTSVVEGGVLIDLSSMKGVRVDRGARHRRRAGGHAVGRVRPRRRAAGRGHARRPGHDHRHRRVLPRRRLRLALPRARPDLRQPGRRPTWSPPTGGWCGPARTRTATCCGACAAPARTSAWSRRYELRTHAIPPAMLGRDADRAERRRGRRRDAAATGSTSSRRPSSWSPRWPTILAPPAPFVPAGAGRRAGARHDRVLWSATRPRARRRCDRCGSMTAHGMDLTQPMPYTAFQAHPRRLRPEGLAELPPRPAPVRARRTASSSRSSRPAGSIGSPMTQGIMFRHGGAVSRVPEDATAAGQPRRRRTWRTRSRAGRRPEETEPRDGVGAAVLRTPWLPRRPAGPTSTSSRAPRSPT